MIKALRNIPLAPFFLVLFFCLHGSLENFGYLDVSEVVIIGLIILFWISLAFLACWLFTRDRTLTGLIIFFIALWYLFFGALQDWLLDSRLFFFLHKSLVLLPFIAICTLIWIIFVVKKKNLRQRLQFYLNVLLLIYCVLDGCLLLTRSLDRTRTADRVEAIDVSKIKAKPNIYFILFDEYPGYTSLKSTFGYSNDSLYSWFKQNDFQILPTFSNYDFTIFSMASILNMRYVENNFDPQKLVLKDFQHRTAEIRNSSVVKLFKQIGYEIKNYSIFDLGDKHSVSDQNSFVPVHSRLLTDKIFHNRIIRTMPWLIKKVVPGAARKFQYEQNDNNKKIENELKESVAGSSVSPAFYYAHLMMPHGPFYYDSSGRPAPDSIFREDFVWPKDLFLSYLKYTNTKMRAIVEPIAQKDKNAIIVVMSDHGFRTPTAKDTNHFNFDNICAVRFPDKNYLPMPPRWGAVNFFRYLFNCEFGQNFPYLKDQTTSIYFE